MNHHFHTNRLLIRQTNESDATFLVDLMNSPGWLEFIGDRQVYTENDAISYIKARIIPQFERLGYGNYMILRKIDNEKIGSCGLYDRDGLEGIDIGYALLPDFQGKGYAFEAVNELKNIAFNHFKLEQINAITNKENLPSRQLLKKIGLSFKSYITLPHKVEEIMLFSSVSQNSSHSK